MGRWGRLGFENDISGFPFPDIDDDLRLLVSWEEAWQGKRTSCMNVQDRPTSFQAENKEGGAVLRCAFLSAGCFEEETLDEVQYSTLNHNEGGENGAV